MTSIGNERENNRITRNGSNYNDYDHIPQIIRICNNAN